MGLMGGQFMTTSLVAENRTLAVPASIQSITSTGDFQDIVSFGLIAGRKARRIVENVNHILSFELMCAAQAADLRGPEKLGPAGKIWENQFFTGNMECLGTNYTKKSMKAYVRVIWTCQKLFS